MNGQKPYVVDFRGSINVLIPYDELHYFIIYILFGPKMHQQMTRQFRTQPVAVSSPIPPSFHQEIFGEAESILNTTETLRELFGTMISKKFTPNSKSSSWGIITAVKITRKDWNTRITFIYKVVNSHGIIQWPITAPSLS
jgi:hypothetical protein